MNNSLSFEEVKILLDESKSFEKALHDLMNTVVRSNVFEVSPGQYQLLFLIHERKDINQKIIAKILHITPATLSVRLQRLEKAGYVSKEVDPSDKRNYILKVNPKGVNMINKGRSIMEDATIRVLEGFSYEDILIIKSYIEKMKNNVGKLKEEMEC